MPGWIDFRADQPFREIPLPSIGAEGKFASDGYWKVGLDRKNRISGIILGYH